VIVDKIRRRARKQLERTRFRLGWREPVIHRANIAPGFRHPIDGRERERLVTLYRSAFPDRVPADLEEARRFLAHEFHFLGQDMKFGREIAWSRDPPSGRDWSLGYSGDIQYRGDGRLGDVKYPWELAKHQHFFTLGKAAWLSGNAAFAREMVAQIDHFIATNPYARGVHWLSALEAGTRAVYWMLTYPFYADHADEAFLARLWASMAQHMRFVETHLSVEAYANNHLVADAAVLAIGGLFLDCASGRQWHELGLGHLETQLERQVHADGVHGEKSVAYHRYVLDQYYLVNAFLKANCGSFTAAARARIERMTEYLMNIVHPDGSIPAFGDGDDARGIWCRPSAIHDYRALLALGAVEFGRADFKHAARGPAEESLWLQGADAFEAFLALEARIPATASRAFPEGGYYVMRSGWEADSSVLSFDCGALGHGRAGHGHADALSVQLFAAGFPFLVDAGTFSYNLDYGWRDRLRGTRAHNTVMIDDADQSMMADRMSWRTQAQTKCRHWNSYDALDIVEGEHDGYARLGDPVTHRRAVVFVKPDVWLVCDTLACAQSHRVEAHWHLRPDCQLELVSPRDFILRSPTGAELRGSLLAQWSADGAAPALMAEAVDDWISPNYGVRLPARTLRFAGNAGANSLWVTSFARSATARCSAVPTDRGLEIIIEGGAISGRVRLLVNPGADALVTLIHPL